MKDQKEMFLSLEIESTFTQMENYFELTSNLIEKECLNQVSEYNTSIQVLEYHFNYTRPLIIYYPYSFLILLYANIESCFKTLCQHLKTEKHLPFSIDKLNGDLGDKIKMFFQAFCVNGLESNDISELNKLNKIRNILVHENGYVSDGKEKIKNLISQEKGVKINSYSNQIEIDLFYCRTKLAYFKVLFFNILNVNGIKSTTEIIQSQLHNGKLE